MLPRCEGGRGDGCEAMAEGNEFIRNLQKRSSDNYVRTIDTPDSNSSTNDEEEAVGLC